MAITSAIGNNISQKCDLPSVTNKQLLNPVTITSVTVNQVTLTSVTNAF